jgi:hypothetical protein
MQVGGRHRTDIHTSLIKREIIGYNQNLNLGYKDRQGIDIKGIGNGQRFIPAADPAGTALTARPGRSAGTAASPVSLTVSPLLITYFTGHQQHGKIIIILQNF